MAEEAPTSMPAANQPDPEPTAQPVQQQEQTAPPSFAPMPSVPTTHQPDTEMAEAAVRFCHHYLHV